jgi:malate permease and related proteins
MTEVLLKFLPVFAGFGVAFAIKKAGWVRPEVGGRLLKIGFYITIPALIFSSVAELGLTRELVVFPLLPAIIVAVTFWVMVPLTNAWRFSRASAGTFRIAPLTINSNFALTFLLATFGSEGVTRAVLFNAGYNPILLLGVYGLAAAYNPGSESRRDVLKRVLILPPLWALIAALAVNASGMHIPVSVMTPIHMVGSLTLVLAVAALGLLFEPRRIRFDKTLAIVGLRMGLGFVIGLGVVVGFGLEGINRAAVLALSVAPIGFNLLTFAAVEKLDKELAASSVSLSILVGVIVMPLILIFSR